MLISLTPNDTYCINFTLGFHIQGGLFNICSFIFRGVFIHLSRSIDVFFPGACGVNVTVTLQ